MRLMWLADVARAAGLDVHEARDWGYRGRDLRELTAIIVHVTVTPDSAKDDNVLELLIRGRRDLPGPLYHFGVERSAKVDVIASGKANHNGYGTWGNQSVGVVLINDGDADRIPSAQYDALLDLLAALCAETGLPVSRILGHKEADPKRKRDPLSLRMDTVRAQVALVMLGRNKPKEVPPRVATTHQVVATWEDEDVQRIELDTQLDEEGRAWLILNGADGVPSVPFGDLISVRPQGSAPGRDGYWPLPETGEQDYAGSTLLTVEGGIPGGTARLWLITRGAA